MEKLGVVGFEPGGRGLKDRVKEIKEALTGRDKRWTSKIDK